MNGLEELRSAAREIYAAALASADARDAVLRAIELEGDALRVCDTRFELRGGAAKVYSVAIGKAAASMASALEERLGDSLKGGVVSAPASLIKLSGRWRVYEGGHPLPNRASLEAARAAFELLRAADEPSSLVVFLVSGGGSAMLELPRDPRVTLEELREANRLLVSCGAAIDEVNAVRRALSRVKGGGLAALATRARRVTLVVSDVGEGRAYDVASGPTLQAPPYTHAVAEVIARYGLASKLPSSVLRALEASDAGRATRPQSEGRSEFRVLLDNTSACEAAVVAARVLGFTCEYARDLVAQDVLEGTSSLVSRLEQLYAREGAKRRRGVCLVSGGEFSCPVRGGGIGGRSSETALRVAFDFERLMRGGFARHAPRHLVALCAGTDGIDGNSPAAGALADETTIERTRSLGLDARKLLEESDSFTLFESLGDAVITGPTDTNVRDLRILLADGDDGERGPRRGDEGRR